MNTQRALILFLFMSGMFNMQAWASIPDDKNTITLNAIPQTAPIDDNIFTKKNVEQYVPSNLTPTNNPTSLSAEFEQKFGQKCVDNFFASEYFKKTPAGHVTETVNQVSQKAISLGPTSTGTPQEVKFQVKAIQHIAEMDYKGYFNSAIVYYLDQSMAAVSVSKPLSKQTNLSLSNNLAISNPQLSPNLLFVYTF